jgi:hypothetical protein
MNSHKKHKSHKMILERELELIFLYVLFVPFVAKDYL